MRIKNTIMNKRINKNCHWSTFRRILTSSLMMFLFLGSGCIHAAGPNLIVNGSFEADDFTDSVAFPNGFTGVNGTFIGTNYNSNTLTGWNITSNVDGWVQGGNWAAAQDGRQYLDIQGNLRVFGTGSVVTVPSNVLSQTINTIPGRSYTLSFYWGEDVGHAPPENVTLHVGIIDAKVHQIFFLRL